MANATTVQTHTAQRSRDAVEYESTVLGVILQGWMLMEFRNSSHIICETPPAKIINRGAKNMTLILLTRTTEMLKTHTHSLRKQPLSWPSPTSSYFVSNTLHPQVLLTQLKTPMQWR